MSEPPIDNKKTAHLSPPLFTLQITDLTMSINPSIVIPDLAIDPSNYLLLNPTLDLFPWLKNKTQILKRTLKVEVSCDNQIVLLRFIHLDKLYQIEYSKIAL